MAMTVKRNLDGSRLVVVGGLTFRIGQLSGTGYRRVDFPHDAIGSQMVVPRHKVAEACRMMIADEARRAALYY